MPAETQQPQILLSQCMADTAALASLVVVVTSRVSWGKTVALQSKEACQGFEQVPVFNVDQRISARSLVKDSPGVSMTHKGS